MEAAAIMAIALANGGVVIFPLLSLDPPFFFSSDFLGFLFLFCFFWLGMLKCRVKLQIGKILLGL